MASSEFVAGEEGWEEGLPTSLAFWVGPEASWKKARESGALEESGEGWKWAPEERGESRLGRVRGLLKSRDPC